MPPLIRFVRCTRAGHNQGELLLELETDDGTRYPFQLTTDCFLRLFVMGWKAAAALPPAAVEGEGPTLGTMSASFAVVDLQPALALLSGPLVLTMLITPDQMAYLQGEYQRYLAEAGRDRPQ